MSAASSKPARPLRALGIVLALWVVGRGMFVWAGLEAAQIPAAIQRVAAPPAAAVADVIEIGIAPPTAPFVVPRFSHRLASPSNISVVGPALIEARTGPITNSPVVKADAGSRREELHTPPLVPSGTKEPVEPQQPSDVAALRQASRPPNRAVLPSDWSGSLWVAARDGSTSGLSIANGQLGGSQAGVRVYRHLSPALALTGRLSTALSAKGSDASVGIALRQGPIALLAERRIALDSGGRNDWSVTAVAGVSDVPLPLGVRLDGYAQAGIVGRDGFADGALRLERMVLSNGSERLAVGAGSWGSVQPGLARLDVGPQIVARTALAGRAIRLSAEWRQRIAGNAAPGSGPVVTLGADF